MKKSICIVLFSLIMFLSYSGIVLAYEKYYNEIYDFSIQLDDGWYIMPAEFYESIPPNERDSLIEAFTYKDNVSKILVNIYDDKTKKYKTFEEIINYAKETDAEERDYSRLVGTIKVEFGNTVNVFEVDETKEEVYFESIGRDSNNNSVGYYVKWKNTEDGLYELKAMLYSDTNEKQKKESENNILFRSFEQPSNADDSNIEVKTNLEETQSTNIESSEDNKEKDLEYYFSLLLDKTVWIILATISILTIIIFILKK